MLFKHDGSPETIVGQFYHTPPTKWKFNCNSELTSSHFIDAMQIIMLYFVELSTK